MRSRGRAWLCLLVLLAVAGCDSTPGPTITAEEARRRGNQLIQETLAVVPTELRFTEEELPEFERESGSGCTRPLEGSGFTGQVQIYVRYLADRTWPPSTPLPEVARQFVAAVAGFWQERGYEVSSSPGGDETEAVLDDDFALRAWYDTRPGEQPRAVYLSAQSPCVWPDGTPDPDGG